MGKGELPNVLGEPEEHLKNLAPFGKGDPNKKDIYNINVNDQKINHIHIPIKTPKNEHHVVINLHVKNHPQKIYVNEDHVEDSDCENKNCTEQMMKDLEKIL